MDLRVIGRTDHVFTGGKQARKDLFAGEGNGDLGLGQRHGGG
jgi:hypothetical protein